MRSMTGHMHLGCLSFLFIDWQVTAERLQTVVVYRCGRLVPGRDVQCQLVLHVGVLQTAGTLVQNNAGCLH